MRRSSQSSPQKQTPGADNRVISRRRVLNNGVEVRSSRKSDAEKSHGKGKIGKRRKKLRFSRLKEKLYEED